MARRRPLSPSQFLAFTFLAMIAAGSLLLALPVSAAESRHLSLLDAAFTAVSAVCVTGLIVVDTARDLSVFGQIVVLVLIQIGGLGYMTLSTVLISALGRTVSLQERLTLQEALNAHDMEGLVRLAATVLRLTLVFELTGALVLALWWWSSLGAGAALWFGLFHAVSAFNNAGFALWSDNLMRWQGDPVVNLVVTTLVVSGGLGFFVWSELLQRKALGLRLSIHTRLVLRATLVLIVFGTVAFLALEWSNPRTLAGLPIGQKVLAAYFQSVTTRTAGFNTVDIGALTVPTVFVVTVLMFIGASPGGTGGGVKTSTFSITLAALWATVRGEDDTVIFKRRLAPELVAKAFFVSLIAFVTVNAVVWLLLLTEGRDLMPSLFETTSAFGTVGLSMGQAGSAVSLSAFFSPVGKLLIMLMMFVGRLGPLTLAIAVARHRSSKPKLRYPEGKVLVG
ncbi:MAG: TrkH family potassium uptake protein [Vicinamibacterales bacterium]